MRHSHVTQRLCSGVQTRGSGKQVFKENLCTDVPSSSIHNSQEAKTAQTPVRRRVGRQHVTTCRGGTRLPPEGSRQPG